MLTNICNYYSAGEEHEVEEISSDSEQAETPEQRRHNRHRLGNIKAAIRLANTIAGNDGNTDEDDDEDEGTLFLI